MGCRTLATISLGCMWNFAMVSGHGSIFCQQGGMCKQTLCIAHLAHDGMVVADRLWMTIGRCVSYVGKRISGLNSSITFGFVFQGVLAIANVLEQHADQFDIHARALTTLLHVVSTAKYIENAHAESMIDSIMFGVRCAHPLINPISHGVLVSPVHKVTGERAVQLVVVLRCLVGMHCCSVLEIVPACAKSTIRPCQRLWRNVRHLLFQELFPSAAQRASSGTFGWEQQHIVRLESGLYVVVHTRHLPYGGLVGAVPLLHTPGNGVRTNTSVTWRTKRSHASLKSSDPRRSTSSEPTRSRCW